MTNIIKKTRVDYSAPVTARRSCDHVENFGFEFQVPTSQAKKFTLLNMEALKDVSTMYVLTPELTFSPSLARTWLV